MDEEKILSLAVIKDEINSLENLMNTNTSSEFLKLCEKYLILAFMYDKINVIEIFLKFGVSPNSKSKKSGWTVLHHAVDKCYILIIEKLIELGAAINAKDDYGNTPLFRAIFKRNTCKKAIILLLENGADKNIKNNTGVSPSDLAKRFKLDLDNVK